MPSRVLIVRTSAMGDVVHTLPMASALREALPKARIGWLIERRFAPLLAGHPAVDEVIEINLEQWRARPLAATSWGELRRFSARLAGFSPDVVIDAMGNHKSGLLAALTLADRRIGAAHAHRREPSSALWISEPVTPRGAHAVDRALSLLEPLGIEAASADFGGSALFADTPTPPNAPAVLIHPGAGWRNKEYPPERWGRVAALLAAASGLEIGVLAGPGEERLADRVLEAAEGAGRCLPAPTLPTLGAALRGARLLLAGDTGPLHLARALGTPVLCVLGPTDPRRNGAYGAPRSNLWQRLPCSFCYKRFDEAKACLLAIEPQAVAERARALLARPAAS